MQTLENILGVSFIIKHQVITELNSFLNI
jgi:hypothetical protein